MDKFNWALHRFYTGVGPAEVSLIDEPDNHSINIKFQDKDQAEAFFARLVGVLDKVTPDEAKTMAEELSNIEQRDNKKPGH